ncbi:hypothetical protein YB2330_002147 [Saitoella coloradoensis]
MIFALSWEYDMDSLSVTSEAKVIVAGTAPGPVPEAISRAVAIPQDNSDILLITRPLDPPDIDNATAFIDEGKGMIKAFNLTNVPADGYNYTTDGTVFAWGLRDTVGFAEDASGSFWATDNGADGITRNGVPLNDNPARIQLLGQHSIPPRISFLAHTAPLGIAFYNPETPSFGKDLVGSAFVSLHGPAGHSIVVVPFKDGEPAAPADSARGYYDFVWTSPSVNRTQCRSALLQAPAGIDCLSPVGLVFDKEGRLYFTADVTGEIFVVTKDQPEDCSES